MNHSFVIKPTTWKADKAALRNIRTLVFMQEQHVSAEDEWDAQDATATHFLVENNSGEAIGCARLLLEDQQDTNLFHIGRVAILAAYRAQGIGTELMRYILAYCQQANSQAAIYLYAQTTRRHFYEQLEFVAKGDEFMDAGIPHITMWYRGHVV